MSAPAAIGFTGSNPNNPTGLAIDPMTGRPVATTPSATAPDPTGYLYLILQQLQQIATATPTPQIFIKVQIIGLGIGDSLNPQPKAPTAPFNKIISNLQRGTVNLYLGPTNANMWDFQFGPTVGPYPYTFPFLFPTQIGFVCDAGSSTDAFGCISLCRE